MNPFPTVAERIPSPTLRYFRIMREVKCSEVSILIQAVACMLRTESRNGAGFFFKKKSVMKTHRTLISSNSVEPEVAIAIAKLKY